jgi:hypothetical protein
VGWTALARPATIHFSRARRASWRRVDVLTACTSETSQNSIRAETTEFALLLLVTTYVVQEGHWHDILARRAGDVRRRGSSSSQLQSPPHENNDIPGQGTAACCEGTAGKFSCTRSTIPSRLLPVWNYIQVQDVVCHSSLPSPSRVVLPRGGVLDVQYACKE